MLRSPHPSAPPQAGLAPSHGRPRSHTAPPTPLPEAPSNVPVELPGSVPERPRAAHHHSFDGKMKPVIGSIHQDPRLDKGPRRSTHPWLSILSIKDKSTSADHPEGPSNACFTPQMPRPQKLRKEVPGTGPKHSKESLRSKQERPPAVQPDAFERAVVSPEQALLQNDSLPVALGDQSTEWSCSPPDSGSLRQTRPLMAQICSMRVSHKSQLQALKESHRQEVASNQQYISFLEQSCGMRHAEEAHLDRCANPNTNRYDQSGSNENSDSTTTTSDKRVSPVASTSNRNWEPQNTTQADVSTATNSADDQSNAKPNEMRSECKNLRNAIRTSQQEIEQSKGLIQRLQASETSLKSTVADLQSRLNESNISRLDIQEGLHEACEQIRKLTERDAGLGRSAPILQSRNHNKIDTPPLVDAASLRPKTRHCRTKSDLSPEHSRTGMLQAQVAEMQKLLLEKDERIKQPQLRCQDHRIQAEKKRKGTSVFCCKKLLSDASPIPTPSARDIVTPTLAGLTHGDMTPQTRPSTTPRQQHQTKVTDRTTDENNRHGTENPQLNPHQPWRNSTPFGKRAASSPSASSIPSPSNSSTRTRSPSALGISLPQTPRTVSTATAEALLLTTEDPSSFTQPRTPPVYLHKKLPKPPSSLDTSPPPAYSPALRRGETMKSVGESIIELYARKDGEEWGRSPDGWVDWV